MSPTTQIDVPGISAANYSANFDDGLKFYVDNSEQYVNTIY